MSTTSWLNISLSIDRIFADLLPTMPRFRVGLPDEEGERRNLVHETYGACFYLLTPGNMDRHQDTYCTLWLCQRNASKQVYTPLTGNYTGVWLNETAANLQAALNEGGDAYWHLFPFYDYKRIVPGPIYAQFLIDGNTTPLAPYLALTPAIVENTGFVVRPGHTAPVYMFDRDPLVVEMTVVFYHWSHDVYCGRKGYGG